ASTLDRNIPFGGRMENHSDCIGPRLRGNCCILRTHDPTDFDARAVHGRIVGVPWPSCKSPFDIHSPGRYPTPMRPILQISLDLTDIDEALSTAALAMRAGVDWLEAGTPFILAYGLQGVKALRQRFPQTPIVADLKTMDGGYLEAEMMAK